MVVVVQVKRLNALLKATVKQYTSSYNRVINASKDDKIIITSRYIILY